MRTIRTSAIICALVFAKTALADDIAPGIDDIVEGARKVSNPVASVISLPFEFNYDGDNGPNRGAVARLYIQPVWPFALNENWNLITRTILPVIKQSDISAIGQSESGVGDVLASQWFSPKEPTKNGWILALGPVESFPTASNRALGSGKFGLGATGLALKQEGPWTYGLLTNHVWSVAGDKERPDTSVSVVQPFLKYLTKTRTILGIQSESTYDWEIKAWTVPINVTAEQIFKAGDTLIVVGPGVRYWAQSPATGPQGWGARLSVTFVFPK